MPRKQCERCQAAPATLKRPRDGSLVCNTCFFSAFEREVHETIVRHKLFEPGQRVAVGASGGKDSTVLMHVLKLLNDRHGYGIELVLVSIDEGIRGYRDDSLRTVHRNSECYGLPLHVLSYKDLYGWTMDEIVAAVGTRSNCTFCGVFRRQALERGALLIGAGTIATGHNADDAAETVLMNVLRADTRRLARCTSAVSRGRVRRVKPLQHAYQKEIVMYAHFKRLEYFATECTYSKEAFRGNARTLLKELEVLRPSCIADVVRSGESWRMVAGAAGDGGDGGDLDEDDDDGERGGGGPARAGAVPAPPSMAGSTATLGGASRATRRNAPQTASACAQCGFVTSQRLCRACTLLEGLTRSGPRVAPHVAPTPIAPVAAAASSASCCEGTTPCCSAAPE